MKRSRLVSLAVVLALTCGVAWGAPGSAAKARKQHARAPVPLQQKTTMPTQQSVCMGFWGICMNSNASDMYCLQVYYACMS